MTKFLAIAGLTLGLLATSAVVAAERTVTLAVTNMYCAACPHIVKGSLEGRGFLQRQDGSRDV
jgi:mercuric ion binding protein